MGKTILEILFVLTNILVRLLYCTAITVVISSPLNLLVTIIIFGHINLPFKLHKHTHLLYLI